MCDTPRVRRPDLLLAVFGVSAACLWSNPAFESASDGGGSTVGTSTSGTSAAASTGAPTTTWVTTTGVGVTATGDTTGEATTTTTVASTDATSTGTTEAVGSTGTTTGGPTDCWGRPHDDWDSVMPLFDNQLGTNPASPQIGPGGQRLVYMAGIDGQRRPYRADAPFTVGSQLIPWPNVNYGIDHPRMLASGKEIILAGRPGMDDQLLVATFDGNAWTDPKPLPAPVNTGKAETIASVTEDGLRVMFQRNDGPMNGDLMNTPTWRFHEATRAADIPGSAFTVETPVMLPPITDDPYPHVNVCPTISPDGLHFFFGSSYPIKLIPANQANALNIFYTSRATPADVWAPAQEITQFRSPDFETCPSSVTRDGCTLVFHRFKFGGGEYQIWFAERSPG